MFALKPTSLTTSVPSHAMGAVANIKLEHGSCRNNCSILGTHTTNFAGFFKEMKSRWTNVHAIRFLLYAFILTTFSHVRGRLQNRKQAGEK
jgi:hypothetical protein